MWKKRLAVIFTGLFLILYQGLTAQTTLPGLLPLQLWQPVQQRLAPIIANDRLTLIVMLSPECPMCRNYTLTLNEMVRQYDKRLAIAGVVPGKSYTDQEIVAFKDEYSLQFELFKDEIFALTKQLSAEVTPEVFLVKPSGEVLYSGAIDNWLTALGKKKPKPDKHYLLNAIDQTLQGKSVNIKRTEAKGCLINDM